MAKKKTEEKKYSSVKPASFRINDRITVESVILLNNEGEPAGIRMTINDHLTGKAKNIEEEL